MSIQKFGLHSLLPDTITLLSGPGCPVCVSDQSFINKAISYARLPNTIITTFGDLIRVPGTSSSLAKEQAKGADVRIIYSPHQALEIAQDNPDKIVIFLAIGFETTAPTSAATILKSHHLEIKNLLLLSSHKTMPPAMTALIDKGVEVNGYIAPGHVSTITGIQMYESFVNNFRVGCVISGFEPLDLMQSIYLLIRQLEQHQPKVENQYSRVVKKEGNLMAKKILSEVFISHDDWWRGLGILPLSGLKLAPKFDYFDAEIKLTTDVEPSEENPNCICGTILRGQATPTDCPLFGNNCTPLNPVGACMVSSEGTCSAYYKYRD